jgi:hypothetical protein
MEAIVKHQIRIHLRSRSRSANIIAVGIVAIVSAALVVLALLTTFVMVTGGLMT